jgi:hypothetical protein
MSIVDQSFPQEETTEEGSDDEENPSVHESAS